MASIKRTVSRGGYRRDDLTVDPDEIEIDMPIPDRYGALNISTSEYLRVIETTFDKTAELVDVMRGTADDLLDIDVEMPEEGEAAWKAAGESFEEVSA